MSVVDLSQSNGKLYSLFSELNNKFNLIRSGKNCSVIGELRELVKLFTEHAYVHFIKGVSNGDPTFGENVFEFLKYAEVSDLQHIGLNNRLKLLLVLLLKLVYNHKLNHILVTEISDRPTLNVNGRMGKCQMFQYQLKLLQRCESPALKEVIIPSFQHLDKQFKLLKQILLYIPSMTGTTLSCEEAYNVSQTLCFWLINSKTVNTVTSKKSVFHGNSTTMNFAASELDGSPSNDIFTVLNIAAIMHHEYALNIYSFSILYHWLMHISNNTDIGESLIQKLRTLPFQLNEDCDDNVSSGSDTTSIKSGSSSATSFVTDDDINFDQLSRQTFADSRSHTPIPRISQAYDTVSMSSDILSSSANSLKSVATRYCLRVINQSEKVPKHNSDRLPLTASVVEAIKNLNLLCKYDPLNLQKVAKSMKRLYQQIEKFPSKRLEIYLALLQFFIDHREELMLQVDDILKGFLRDMPLKLYCNQIASYGIIEFSLQNCEFFKLNKLFFQYFPNLFKVCVWWIKTFLDETCQLILMITYPKNCCEVLHFILDLPCLTALLYLKDVKLIQDDSKLTDLLQCPMKTYYKSMFKFILREVSGGPETIDRLAELHKALMKLKENQRVKYCIESVPVLLESFFTRLIAFNDGSSLKSIFPLLLERVSILYSSADVYRVIRNIFTKKLKFISKTHPDVASIYQQELLVFCAQISPMDLHTSYTDFFTSVVWCIGTGVNYYNQKQLYAHYDYLEVFIYQVASNLLCVNPELINTVITALAKLIASNQELLKPGLACLSKISSLELCNSITKKTYKSTSIYAEELANVLKRPKTASQILCCIDKVKPWHLDPNDSVLMKIQFLTK